MKALFLSVLAVLAVSSSASIHGVVVAGPSGVVSPHGAVGPLGLGLGHGLWGGYGHGIAVQGPATVPVVIAGPSGKIVADGLYGVPHWGHHW